MRTVCVLLTRFKAVFYPASREHATPPPKLNGLAVPPVLKNHIADEDGGGIQDEYEQGRGKEHWQTPKALRSRHTLSSIEKKQS